MSRVYIHRYKVLTGPLKGFVGEGVQIGVQDYPDQFKNEQLTTDQITCLWQDKYNKGLGEGIWINEVKQPFYRLISGPGLRQPKVETTDEGVNYDDVYMDLCVPFDRFNKEIFVGDTIYISSKNEVIPCVVEKIAKKPFMASYGIMNRKLTLRPTEGGTAKTINDPRSTVKA
jgi:hypothetical protein